MEEEKKENSREPEEKKNAEDGKIRIEQLIFAEFDRSLVMKERLEAKVGGYMTVITLILTILVQFSLEFYKSDICNIFRKLSLGFCICFFFFGVILLFMCIKMIFPKKVKIFDINQLLKLRIKTLEEINKELLDDVKRFYEQNIAIVDAKGKINSRIAEGLVILVIGFVVTAILFFAMLQQNECPVA